MQTLPKQPFYRKLFIFAALLAFFTWYGLGRLDPDFGWHLQAGRDILAHGIPKTDLYTYTARDFPWIDHEWLSDVLLAWLFASGGWALVNLIYAGIWSLALWLAGKRHDLLVLSLAVLAIYGYSGVRQLAWTTLLFVIARRLLQKPGRRNYLIVPLMLVWANLHGGFILGLAVLAGNWFTRRTWRNLMLGAVSFGMTFINPYGWRIYIEIFRTLFDPALHRFISEWQILNYLGVPVLEPRCVLGDGAATPSVGI
jgi:hypothetical protein